MVLRPLWDELTVEQQAFAWISVWVGMPRLEKATLKEFARRAAVYQEVIGSYVFDGNGPVTLTEEDWASALEGNELVWSNASRLSAAQFERKADKERKAMA